MTSSEQASPAAGGSESAESALETSVDNAGLSRSLAQVWPILLLAIVLFAVLRWQAVHLPLERDEGEYAYIAQRMLHGEVPYRDTFDQKPPGVFVAYLIPVWLSGTSVAAIHLLAYVWTLGTAVMLFLLIRDLAGQRAAALALVFFSVLTVCPEWEALAANTELFMLLPMTAATWCVGRALASERASEKCAWNWWLAAGVLSLLAALFKQVALANVGFLAVWAFLSSRARHPEQSFRAELRAAGWFVGGMAVVSLVTGTTFMALGAGREFFDCVIWHNVRYSQHVGWDDARSNLWGEVRKQSGTFWGMWVLTALALLDLRRERRSLTALLAGWILFSAAGVSIGFYFRGHYFIQLAPVYALACGLTLDRWTQRINQTLPAIGASLLTAAVAGVCVLPWLMPNQDFWFRSDSDQKTRLLYGVNPFPESAELASQLRDLSGTDETVLVYGSEPQLLFLAERRSATRYILFYPLMMPLAGAVERQHEAFKDILASRPRVVLRTNLQPSLLMFPQTDPFLNKEVAKLLTEGGYELAGFREYNQRLNTSKLVFQKDAEQELERRHAAQDDVKPEQKQFFYDMLVFVRK